MQELKSITGRCLRMAKDELFRIEWTGIEELEQEFDRMEKSFQNILVEEYTKYGLLVEEGAKALAPYDEGDLEQSIVSDKAQVKGNTVSVGVGSNSPYAVRRHEEPYKSGRRHKYDNGSRFDDYYRNGIGRGTSGKGNWRGYQPGRKFLENAVLATEDDYDEMNKRILERVLGGKK